MLRPLEHKLRLLRPLRAEIQVRHNAIIDAAAAAASAGAGARAGAAGGDGGAVQQLTFSCIGAWPRAVRKVWRDSGGTSKAMPKEAHSALLKVLG